MGTERLILIQLVLVVLALGNTLAVDATARITDKDKAEIIKQMLGRELVGKEVDENDDLISDFELLMRLKAP